MKDLNMNIFRTIAVAGTLFLAATQASYAERDGMNFREFREQNPQVERFAARQAFRQIRQNARDIGKPDPRPYPNIPQIGVPFCPPNMPTINTVPRISNIDPRKRSMQVNAKGNLIRLETGVNLDLTSGDKNITLGRNLFNDTASIQIQVGNDTKTLSAGSQVSAAEYVAVKQVLSGDGQKLIVDRAGRADGGEVDLSSLTQGNDVMRARNLVVAKDVTTYGDFGRGSDFKLLGDLNNYGTVHASSSLDSVKGGAIRADDINNYKGATISSTVDLTLDAANNLNNEGVITSTGALTLTAGGAVSNSGSVSAAGDLTLASANVNNSGSINSESNVNLAGSSLAALVVNNSGGKISALNGSINVRDAGYTGEFDSLVAGGDLLSKELNLHSGHGVANVNVNELTGFVNETGTAAHVQAQTAVLNIGNVCLTGDPTFYNLLGDIFIADDVIVEENLVFIAAGNIETADNIDIFAGSTSTLQGFDITFIAGADFTAEGGNNSPSVGPVPPITNNGAVTLSGKASKVKTDSGTINGGSITLGDGVTVATQSLGAFSNKNAGNIYLNAFQGKKGSGTGSIDFGSATLDTSGTGTGNNGDIFALASASDGAAITAGIVNTVGGTGTTGFVGLYTVKLTSSVKGQKVSYDANGNRIGEAILTGNGVVGGDIFVTNADLANPEITASDDVAIFAGGDFITSGEINSGGDIEVEAGGSIEFNASADAASSVVLNAAFDIRDDVDLADAAITAGDHVSMFTDKGNIGTEGNPFTIDAPSMDLFNGGDLANVEVLDNGNFTIGSADSEGNLVIQATDRDLFVVDDLAAASIDVSANTFQDISGIYAKNQVVLRANTGDLINDPFDDIETPNLVLIANNGNIGESTNDRLVLGGIKEVSFEANGNVFAQFTDTKEVIVRSSEAETIDIVSAGSLTLDGFFDAYNGGLNVSTAAGTLTVEAELFGDTGVSLENLSAKGKITFVAESQVISGLGDINISVGPTSATPATLPEDNFDVVGGGSVILTGAGVKGKAPVNLFEVLNADIIINNGAKSSGNIFFGGDVNLEANGVI